MARLQAEHLEQIGRNCVKLFETRLIQGRKDGARLARDDLRLNTRALPVEQHIVFYEVRPAEV